VRVLEFLSKKLKEKYGSDAKAVIVVDIFKEVDGGSSPFTPRILISRDRSLATYRYRYPIIIDIGFSTPISNYRYDLGLGRRNVIVGILASENLVLLQKWIHQTFQKRVYSLLHILSKKGMKGMKPSSSSGSHSSFIRSLASCLFSFSPRLVRRRKSSLPIMVLSSFLS